MNFIYMRSAFPNEKNIQSQREEIRNYMRVHSLNPENFEEVVDNGHSGIGTEPPGLQNIIRLAEQKAVDTVIISELSRLSRDCAKASYYLQELFPKYGVRLLIADINDEYFAMK